MPKDNRGGKRAPNETGIRKLQKSNANLQKRIAEHKSYIKDPTQKYSNWDSFDDARKAREINHWKQEIQTFQNNIAANNLQIKKIKESKDG